jgi:hypothetical protein
MRTRLGSWKPDVLLSIPAVFAVPPMSRACGQSLKTPCGTLAACIALGAILSLVAAGRAVAQGASPVVEATDRVRPKSAPPDPDAWRLQATAYGWLMGVSGSMTARGQTVDVNASFLQIVDKSDSLAAFMGYFEADKGRVGFYTDFVWTRLGFDKSTVSYRNRLPGLQVSAKTTTVITSTMTIVEAGGLYEVARWQDAPGSFTAVDALLGFRYWNNIVDLNLDVIGSVDLYNLGIERGRTFAVAHSGNLDWVDPLIGVRVRHEFTPSQQVMVRGDLGGFGFASQFAWQAVGVYSYAWQFNGYALAGVLGYRAIGVNYANGYGINANGVNLVLHGPVIGFTVRF